MEEFLVSLVAVGIGEIGDKTQLLSLVLGARYRKPVPIILGIAVATLANHGLAAFVGRWIADFLTPDVLRIALGISFAAIAIWTLKPDKLDEVPETTRVTSVFLITLGSFFLAEVGDKTQLVTMALAARFPNIWLVIAGSATGILLADVPIVLIGHRAGPKLPLRAIRFAAAILFAALACYTFWSSP